MCENINCNGKAARTLTDPGAFGQGIINVHNNGVSFISFDERSRKPSVDDQQLPQITIRS